MSGFFFKVFIHTLTDNILSDYITGNKNNSTCCHFFLSFFLFFKLHKRIDGMGHGEELYYGEEVPQ